MTFCCLSCREGLGQEAAGIQTSRSTMFSISLVVISCFCEVVCSAALPAEQFGDMKVAGTGLQLPEPQGSYFIWCQHRQQLPC